MDTAKRTLIARHLETSAAVKRKTAECCEDGILRAADLLVEVLRTGGKIMLCGNGGSAADSQHIAAEFTSLLRTSFSRPGLAAIALTTDTSYLTARANDFGFDEVYSRLVQAIGRPGDVLIGISTSGRSRNVVAALRQARGVGIRTVVLTGRDPAAMGELADVALPVPSEVTQHIQETHITVGHILCQLVEEELFKSPAS